ncbi:MAG TPA: alcohol dehydrogenase catalytic domain-containing protein, partial [Spirochaetales bacterium]|nr:alcohol dehydrogenase catalytic domain-containing protein [Spirochaetales bacterium]
MEKKTKAYKIPETMKAWVLENKNEVKLVEKSVPHPGPAEVLLHVDAVAICGTDLEILERGLPAMVEGGLPFNKNLTIGHEYMGTVVELGAGVDEFKVG